MDQPAAIAVQNLSKHFGRKAALCEVSFHIPAGSVCGFVGPNGAGKTTTIKTLMGLLPPSRGSVRVLGLDPLRQSLALRQRIGYVPEQHNIYKWMTIRQVLTFAGSIYHNWDRHECDRVLSVLRLPMDRRVRQLSHGEMAKLALTIALSHRPDLLVLDEPTTGLDPLVRQEFLDAIITLIRAEGRTVFFSSHILSDVERVADRLVVLREGRVLAHDTLDALRLQYTKASFLFPSPPNGLVIPEALRVHKGLREWVVIFRAMEPPRLRELASHIGASDCLVQQMTVEDVFLELFEYKGAN